MLKQSIWVSAAAWVAMLIALLLAPSAQADIQYWMSVHSFKKEANARQAVVETSAVLSERFTVVGSSTSLGYYYRVVSGPYLSQEIAEQQVRAAQAAGFDGAWLWADNSEVFAAAYSELREQAARGSSEADAEYAATGYAASNYDVTDYSAADYSVTDYDEGEFSYSDYSSYGLDDPLEGQSVDEDPDLTLRRQPPPELVEEAPPGYQLNKLHRSN